MSASARLLKAFSLSEADDKRQEEFVFLLLVKIYIYILSMLSQN